MPNPDPSRKQLFRAALAIAGLSAAQWADGAGVTPQWLSMVLNGKSESQSLTDRIDAFVQKQLKGANALAS